MSDYNKEYYNSNKKTQEYNTGSYSQNQYSQGSSYYYNKNNNKYDSGNENFYNDNFQGNLQDNNRQNEHRMPNKNNNFQNKNNKPVPVSHMIKNTGFKRSAYCNTNVENINFSTSVPDYSERYTQDINLIDPNYSKTPEVLTWHNRYDKSMNSENKRDYLKKREDDDQEFLNEHYKKLENKEKSLMNNPNNTVSEEQIFIYDDKYEIVSLKQEEEESSLFSKIKGLKNILKENLETMRFTTLTKIQKAVIPFINDGYDIMGCAKTGSGKTVAFILPTINKMLVSGPPDKPLNFSKFLK